MQAVNTKLKAMWDAMAGFLGLVAGLTPHVLHHIGLIAGLGFLTGTVGMFIFGVIGLLMTVPLLLKLHRKFNTLLAPAIALVIFIGMFLLSALVIGPAIRGERSKPASNVKVESSHEAHH